MAVKDALTCLLVDDDLDDQDIFKATITRIDPQIHCMMADSAGQALNILQGGENPMPDVIFIDINLPKTNGIQFLKELKQIPEISPIPVYMYSTTNRKDMIDQCTRLGAAGFVVKSASPDKLRETLEAIFSI